MSIYKFITLAAVAAVLSACAIVGPNEDGNTAIDRTLGLQFSVAGVCEKNALSDEIAAYLMDGSGASDDERATIAVAVGILKQARIIGDDRTATQMQLSLLPAYAPAMYRIAAGHGYSGGKNNYAALAQFVGARLLEQTVSVAEAQLRIKAACV